MDYYLNRQHAIKEGKGVYLGPPCTYGHGSAELGNKRRTKSHECIACKRKADSIRARNKRAEKGAKVGRPRKYPEIVGPVRPRKKRDPKPVTDFEQWVYRSRHNKKNVTLRKQLTQQMYLALYRTHCPLLGIELTYKAYTPGLRPPANYASLDRIDPKKGYIEGNVQILSFRANSIKSDATLEELETMATNWKKISS